MRILLHICCGVCAAGVAEQLMEEGHAVTGFFYNPNIYPEDEYKKRLENARKVSIYMGFELIEGEYDYKAWDKKIEMCREEPEGGERCSICFSERLRKTHELFLKGGYDLFTTTLTISPLKSAYTVNKIGSSIGGDKFLAADFKKRNGFKRAIELAKKIGLYRQEYCGCEYSLRNR